MKTSLLFLLILPLLAFSQNEFYNGGAAITVQQGALVHVQGSFTNDAGSTYNNDGILEVKGNFANNGSAVFYPASIASTDRVVKFVGSGTQQITGNLSTSGSQSLYNMVVDQSTASDSVEMRTNLLVEKNLVFGSSNTTSTYSPSALWTSNGGNGLIKTFADHYSTNPTGQYLLSVENPNFDAITGYAPLAMFQSPTTAFILTEGMRGNPNGFTNYIGLQRNINNTSGTNYPTTGYVYPVGTIAKGYNPAVMHFTSLAGGGGQDVVANFSDADPNTNGGYVGNLSQYCNVCTGNYPYPDNPGFNYLFTNNPCYGGEEWIILEQTNQNHGYWNITSTTDNSAYQYWVEMYSNGYNPNESPLGAKRTLKYHQSGLSALNEFYYDPSSDNWTSQIMSGISQPSDLYTYTGQTDCYTGNGIPGGLYTGFSHFGLFSENSNDALPVTMLYLEAFAMDNTYIQLRWATASEINNNHFTVERSTDGQNWEDIGTVAGHDNTTAESDYTYNDMNVVGSVRYYYRLKQVDNNGTSANTEVVTAMLNGTTTFRVIGFQPNPTANATNLMISTTKNQEISIDIYDMIGRKVISGQQQITVGTNEIGYDMSKLASGTYSAIVTSANEIYTQKLVITK